MYIPDKWRLVKLVSEKDKAIHYRVFAGWYGGYTSGDSWKLNSGITKVKECKDYYDFYGSSGSLYRCMKEYRGMSMYMCIVLEQLKKTEAVELTLAEYEDLPKELKDV